MNKTYWEGLWDDARPYLAGLAGFSFVINLLYLVPALFTLHVFDRVLPANSKETLLVLLLPTGFALAVLVVLDYLRSRLQYLVGSLLNDRLAPAVVETVVAHLARGPRYSGMVAVRDVATVRNLFANQGLQALFDAPWAPLFILLIWSFHPLLGMGAALAGGVMLLLAWLNDRTSRKALERLQNESRTVSRYLESALRNAEVLQALGMTGHLLARWQAQEDRLGALQAGAGKRGMFFASATRGARQAIQSGMLALGAWLVLTQHASPGVMIATTILLGRAVQPVEQLVGSWRALADARAAWLRLRALSAEFGFAETHLRLPCPHGRLVVERLGFLAAGRQQVLSNICFVLEAGQALAVVGPSGAGKSTMARLLTGVWQGAAGSVRLDGADLAGWPRQDLGPWIGYLPQDVELFEGTVADNIARLLTPDPDQVVAAARRAHAHEMILSLPQGYQSELGEGGMLLSPGQRQRIALARALYCNPRLVVLDEPNSNLDAAGEEALAQAIRALRAEGVSTVIITHRPALIAHVDRILVLENGRIRQFGPAAEVMQFMRRRAQAALDGKVA